MGICLKHIKKEYKDADRVLTIIDGLTFEIPSNRSVAIVGKSGVGKSTLLHLIGGLDHATSGDILFDNQNICGLNPDALSDFRAKNIGFIFQFHHLLPEFSAIENVAMPLIIGGAADASALQQSREILSYLGLSARLDHRPGQLSGGEQQRVAIARAVVAEPKVILADEPTGNLDFATSLEVQELLLKINRELKNTLIIVTHNMDLARSMDVVLEMQPGGVLRVME